MDLFRPARLATRVGLALAGLSWVGEGYLERRTLSASLTERESVPGQSKIVEHFVLQHVVFPAIAFGLAFRPAQTRSLLAKSPPALGLLALTSLVLCVPETRVSLNSKEATGDLFRPYPFALPPLARRVEVVDIAGRPLNVVQALHLGLNHFLFTAVLLRVWRRSLR